MTIKKKIIYHYRNPFHPAIIKTSECKPFIFTNFEKKMHVKKGIPYVAVFQNVAKHQQNKKNLNETDRNYLTVPTKPLSKGKKKKTTAESDLENGMLQ